MEKLVRVVKFIFTLSPNRLLVTNSVWAFTPTTLRNCKRADTIATPWHPLPYLNHIPQYTLAPQYYRGVISLGWGSSVAIPIVSLSPLKIRSKTDCLGVRKKGENNVLSFFHVLCGSHPYVMPLGGTKKWREGNHKNPSRQPRELIPSRIYLLMFNRFLSVHTAVGTHSASAGAHTASGAHTAAHSHIVEVAGRGALAIGADVVDKLYGHIPADNICSNINVALERSKELI